MDNAPLKTGTKQLTPLPYALTAEIGHASMYVSEAHNQGSSLVQAMTDYFPSVFGSRTEHVALTTIDALTEGGARFDVWKLDIEGAEIDALKGAASTFMHSPPRTIIAEVFDPFLKDFLSIIPEKFSFRRRAYISEDDYSLVLQPIGIVVNQRVYHHSPMYVFARPEGC